MKLLLVFAVDNLFCRTMYVIEFKKLSEFVSVAVTQPPANIIISPLSDHCLAINGSHVDFNKKALHLDMVYIFLYLHWPFEHH